MNLITKECKFSTDACCWWQNNTQKATFELQLMHFTWDAK